MNGDELLFKVDVHEKDGTSREKEGRVDPEKIPILNFAAPSASAGCSLMTVVKLCSVTSEIEKILRLNQIPLKIF